MRLPLAAALALAALPASGEPAVEAVRRGDLEVRVKVTGTVVPADVFRLKSTIDGRIETVLTSSYSWRGADQTLAFMAHKELAAILDARGTQDKDILEDRWQRVYRPTPIRCPSTCFVLKVFAKAKTWVKPQTVMFEAARSLQLVARVRPEDSHWVRDGQPLTFWAVKDPSKKFSGRVARFVLDVQGQKVDPGGTFTLELSPDRYFDPGTEWEGIVAAETKKNVLFVPTASLLSYKGNSYLPVRVSTGITTAEFTQINAGAEEKRPVLVLDEADLKGAARHKQEPDRPALERRARELQGRALPDDEDEPRSRRRQPEDGDFGEDPYAD
ncbi:MAG: hypothetical protein SF051_04925 [Elusimicrobiota bacterium]|nr:hypothetical protein [Elusimicrobiota bacterium]